MARIRTIKPSFFRHHALFRLEQSSGFPMRVAFAGLWTCADREGRFRWVPEELKLDCTPHDTLDFGALLDALSDAGFIIKYEVDGVTYGAIPSFLEHQVINNREQPSALPAPNAKGTRAPRKATRAPRVPGACPTPVKEPLEPLKRNMEGKGREEDSVAKATGADAPLEPLTESDLVWGDGLRWLASSEGRPADALRSMLGRWCKVYGDGHVLAALSEARSTSPPIIGPVAWIEAHLKARNRDGNQHRRAQRGPSNGFVAAALEATG
jgi:hypothetical protein